MPPEGMKIGIIAWLTKHTVDPATAARACEAAGFESFFMAEHPVMPVEIKTRPLGGDEKIPDFYPHLMDPFLGLASAASVTYRIKLGTGICLVPERDPKMLAKEVSTLDLISRGRFIFGIGAGWLAEESRIMGVDFRRRWDITTEYVRAMKELWTSDAASFEGEFVRFPAVVSSPKPVQKPYPPITIGANSEAGFRCAVAVGDGWCPIRTSPDQLKMDLEKLRRMCEEAGRDFSKFEITLNRPLPTLEPKRAIDEYRAAGAHRLVLTTARFMPDNYKREIEDLWRAWLK